MICIANAANTDSLNGYTTLNLCAKYKIAKDWTIGAKIGNVLNTDYQTNKGTIKKVLMVY